MGLVASQARLHMLVARKSDLELQLQFINQARMQLANLTSQMWSLNANLEPGSAEDKRIQARIAALQAQDKSFEMQANRINTQHQAVQTEVDAVRKVISQNIQSSFKLMG